MRLVRIVAALCVLAGGRARALSPSEGHAIMTGQLQDILGKDKRIRDYAPFETERGEGALLVLYATDVVEPADDAAPPETPSCSEQVSGVPLPGRYHVALVVRGALVNSVEVPSEPPLPLPLTNQPELNARYYGQGAADIPDAPQPTRLVKLADFNGDGNAWEFRLVRPGDCRHVGTLLAGYSARERRAVLFPIVRGSDRRFWADDFFPSPTTPDARRVTIRRSCDGDGEASEEKYAYDARREAWILAHARRRSCPQAASRAHARPGAATALSDVAWAEAPGSSRRSSSRGTPG